MLIEELTRQASLDLLASKRLGRLAVHARVSALCRAHLFRLPSQLPI